jgi:hypothetical protein
MDKSYFVVLRMRDFRARRLKRLNNDRLILAATSELASDQTVFGSASSCALPFQLHGSILPAKAIL